MKFTPSDRRRPSERNQDLIQKARIRLVRFKCQPLLLSMCVISRLPTSPKKDKEKIINHMITLADHDSNDDESLRTFIDTRLNSKATYWLARHFGHTARKTSEEGIERKKSTCEDYIVNELMSKRKAA